MRLIRNIIKNTILLSLSILIVNPMSVLAQDMSSAQSEADRAREERSKRDGQRTKKSQAVSKSVYEKMWSSVKLHNYRK